MKKSIHVFLIALLVWQVSSTGFSQGALGDSSMRREAAARISREHGVNVDYDRRPFWN
jgi:hypothetical protein